MVSCRRTPPPIGDNHIRSTYASFPPRAEFRRQPACRKPSPGGCGAHKNGADSAVAGARGIGRNVLAYSAAGVSSISVNHMGTMLTSLIESVRSRHCSGGHLASEALASCRRAPRTKRPRTSRQFGRQDAGPLRQPGWPPPPTTRVAPDSRAAFICLVVSRSILPPFERQRDRWKRPYAGKTACCRHEIRSWFAPSITMIVGSMIGSDSLFG